MKILPIATLLLLLQLPACGAQDAKSPDGNRTESMVGGCAEKDSRCAYEAGRKHVVKKISFWKPALGLPPNKRIGTAPPELIEFLKLDVMAQSIAAKPKSPTLTPDFIAEVTAAFDELPEEVRRLLGSRLLGIYFIEDIGGSGFTDMAFDENGNATAGFIVLDPAVLMQRAANEWATWRDNTPFKPGSEFRLVAEIEAGNQNNRKNTIQYILLHELAHVISIGGSLHPSWNIQPGEVTSLSSYPFFQLSWRRSDDGKKFISRFDAQFPQRTDVVYYFGARLATSQMADIYEKLEQTNFVTLYGATRPGDDFAEAFANYVHTVMMGRPFAIRIYREGKVAKVFEACWKQPRCAEKKKILEDLLGAAPGKPTAAIR